MAAEDTTIKAYRFNLLAHLKTLPVMTGDILFRRSDARGPYRLPFCKLVSMVTKSEFTHAAIIVVWAGLPHVVEVTDRGTILYRLIDWFDYCYQDKFDVYRLENAPENFAYDMNKAIGEFLLADPDYDFNFSDPKKFYCTESVVDLYRACGIELCKPSIIKDLMGKWEYKIFSFLNNFCLKFTGIGFDVKTPCYFVGNEKHGIASSPLLRKVGDNPFV